MMPPQMPQGNPFLQLLMSLRGQGQGQSGLQQGLAGLMQGDVGLGRGQGQMLRPTNPGMPGMMTPGQMGQGGMFSGAMQPQQQPQQMGGGFTGGRDNPRRMMMQRMGMK
jgi:hypothetical protein